MAWPIKMHKIHPLDSQPGDAWPFEGSWAFKLPGGAVWTPIQPPGWTIEGEMPNVTVRPSINQEGVYHGWITNGVLSDDIEGRTY